MSVRFPFHSAGPKAIKGLPLLMSPVLLVKVLVVVEVEVVVVVVVASKSGNTAMRRTDEQVVAIAAKISRITGAISS